MFARSYFAGRFFAPRYYPPAGATPTPGRELPPGGYSRADRDATFSRPDRSGYTYSRPDRSGYTWSE